MHMHMHHKANTATNGSSHISTTMSSKHQFPIPKRHIRLLRSLYPHLSLQALDINLLPIGREALDRLAGRRERFVQRVRGDALVGLDERRLGLEGDGVGLYAYVPWSVCVFPIDGFRFHDTPLTAFRI